MDSQTSSAYAFVAWLSTYVLFFLFCVWAFLPDATLSSWGLTYYPSKYYAVAFPSYLLMFSLFVMFLYVGVNMMCSPDPSDMITVGDFEPENLGSLTASTKSAPAHFVKFGAKDGIPLFGDIDPVALSLKLHGRDKADD